MTTLLDDFTSTTEENGHRLREATAAARVSFHWFGTRKSLSSDQKAQAADTFGAEEKFLSAGQKAARHHPPRLETSCHPEKTTSSVTGGRFRFRSPSRAFGLFAKIRSSRSISEWFEYREELTEAVWRLNEHYAELKSCGNSDGWGVCSIRRTIPLHWTACSRSSGIFRASNRPST